MNDAVAEVIRKLIKNPKFEEEIKHKSDKCIDTDELEQEVIADNAERQEQKKGCND